MATQVCYAEGYREKFLSTFSELRSEIVTEELNNPETVDAMKHFREVLEYNFPHGKCPCNCGLMVIGSLCHLKKGVELSPEEERKALILGWCVELLQAFFLVADDVMNQSMAKTRKDQLCLLKKVLVILPSSTVFRVLKKFFKSEPYYVDILELFQQTTYQTEVGQCLDMITSPPDINDVDLSKFSIDRYKAIVKYKTAYYSFYLPVALAMHMAGMSDNRSYHIAEHILLILGEFFQIQDDYFDCYGDPAVTGKVGTDIEECKCSWLIVQALERATPEQKSIIEKNYGKNDPACVQEIKKLYDELKLKEVYHQYEESSYQEVMLLLDVKLKETCLPRGVFQEYVDRIYKRQK